MVYFANAIRIRAINGKNFGYMKTNNTEQVYEAHEIVFHTPGEHHVKNQKFEMEV